MGPFAILEKLGASAYKLDLPDTAGWNRKHPVFNEKLLKPYVEPVFSNQQLPAPPGPLNVNGADEYEVERILDSQKTRNGRGIQYYVKWNLPS